MILNWWEIPFCTINTCLQCQTRVCSSQLTSRFETSPTSSSTRRFRSRISSYSILQLRPKTSQTSTRRHACTSKCIKAEMLILVACTGWSVLGCSRVSSQSKPKNIQNCFQAWRHHDGNPKLRNPPFNYKLQPPSLPGRTWWRWENHKRDFFSMRLYGVAECNRIGHKLNSNSEFISGPKFWAENNFSIEIRNRYNFDSHRYHLILSEWQKPVRDYHR